MSLLRNDHGAIRSGWRLAIYLAGADPWEGDRWGRMGLTKDGLRRRDRRVFESLRMRRIPVAVTMSGGYAPDVDDTVEIHLETVTQAVRAFEAWRAEPETRSATP